MSLYTPEPFRQQAPDAALALLRAAPFATLITSSAAAEPYVTHLPLLLLRDGVLTGHMARANPHWQAFAAGHTMAIFQGPHGYISPQGYETPEQHVPTWNYAVVHVHGQPQLIDSPAEKLALVDATSAAFEQGPEPWRRQLSGPRLDAMLREIVGFELPLTRVEAKFKMSQNRTDADRAKVVRTLLASGAPEAHALANWMQRHEPG